MMTPQRTCVSAVVSAEDVSTGSLLQGMYVQGMCLQAMCLLDLCVQSSMCRLISGSAGEVHQPEVAGLMCSSRCMVVTWSTVAFIQRGGLDAVRR